MTHGTDNWDDTMLAHWIAGEHAVRQRPGNQPARIDRTDEGALARWFDDGGKTGAPVLFKRAPAKTKQSESRLKVDGVDVGSAAEDSLRKGSA